ncbi:MAG: SPASM domain-containing protein, partial [Nitrospirota bacterium]|nr:SPASM domain-containing protein [Nitrospirota bacterium]
ENHDYYRPFKSGSGTFDIIIRNLKETCEIIKIQIGGNFNPENYRGIPYLLDYLIEQGITPEKISLVKFAPISKTGEKFAPPEFTGGCASINEPWLIEASIFLREEILKRGFNTPRITPSFCMIESPDDIVVNYDGTLYKCPGFIGWKGFEVGDLRTGIRYYHESHNLDLWKKDECLDCEYLPLCFGGCRYMKLLRDGNIDDVDCRKPFLDATLETFIKQDITYILKADNC